MSEDAFKCHYCGGRLRGEESVCPFCGLTIDRNRRIVTTERPTVGLDSDSPYYTLRIRYSYLVEDVLEIEFTRQDHSDVVKEIPVVGAVHIQREEIGKIENDLRELLLVIASNREGSQIIPLSRYLEGIGKRMFGFFPDNIQAAIRESKGDELLHLALDDKVVGLPWELSFDGNEYLCNKFGVGRIVYTKNVKKIMKKGFNNPVNVLIISNPDGSLQSSQTIVAKTIRNYLEGIGAKVDELYFSPGLETHSNRRQVIGALASGKYDIIHFDGHGYHNKTNPQHSFLLLAENEFLTGQDLKEIFDSLTVFEKKLPILFFASACESGAQRSWDMKSFKDQILGVSQVFVSNNISYIGATWSAIVDSSNLLSISFYNHFLVQRQTIGMALNKARIDVISNFGISYGNCDWANFILYGEPSLFVSI